MKTPEDFWFKTEAEERAYNSALIDLHPEIKSVFKQDSANYGLEYLGFLCVYRYALHRLENCKDIDMIVDIGCGAGIQSVLFKGRFFYQGVDRDPVRMKGVEIDQADGLEWLEENADNYWPENTFAICSAVPDQKLQKEVAKRFRYHLVTYPTKILFEQLPEGATP